MLLSLERSTITSCHCNEIVLYEIIFMYAFHPLFSLLVVIIPLFDIIVATYNYYYDYLFVISQVNPKRKINDGVARQ